MTVSPTDDKLTSVRYEYTAEFPRILEHIRGVLAITTYQGGQLVVVGVEQGKLAFSFHSFQTPMGIAVSNECIAIGSRNEIHLLRPAHDIAPRINPIRTYDSAWLNRGSWHTGAIQGHEMAWSGDRLFVVNTLFSCICFPDERYSFQPYWRPPFVSALEPNDRCHLNGLAMRDGRPAFVTAHGVSDQPGGWRENKAKGGVIVDVESGQIVAQGLAMPHSPRWALDKLWVLHSGSGALCTVDISSGRLTEVSSFPGYVRGLDFSGQFGFVGLSKIRERSVFGDLPIESERANLRCGVGVVDLISGRTVATLQFHSGVDEIFSVAVLPGTNRAFVVGPNETDAPDSQVWLLPHSALAPGQTQFSTSESKSLDQAAGIAATALQLHQQGRLQEALVAFQKSLELNPEQAEVLCNLGNLWQDLEDQHQALDCYRKSLELDPTMVPASQNLGYLLCAHGHSEEASQVYQSLVDKLPSPMNQVLAAGILPIIYQSTAEVQNWRQRLNGRLDKLVAAGAKIDTDDMLVPTSFFLAYQGHNDVEIMKKFGSIYQGKVAVPPTSTQLKPRTDGRLRVGFMSAYFRDHTIGRLNLGRIQHLNRQKFEVTLISVGNHKDPVASQFRAASDRFLSVERRVSRARERIVDQDLDVLIFTDVGMDALSTTLAWSRMAPVQCVTWGHPETTGSPNIDYFLSSELLEVPEADFHYSEKLVRLNRLGTYFERPIVADLQLPLDRRSRQTLSKQFGLETSTRHYVCPQTLYKMHPDFDTILAGILQTDTNAEIVLIEGREENWTKQLRSRFNRTLPEGGKRVRWLKPLPRPDFLRLLAAADVLLDPLHFGGGHTSYEALAMATPVVTLPGQFLRSRISLALYRLMDMRDLVVSTPQEYINLATRIANDESFRQELSLLILQKNSLLFDNKNEVEELERWLWSLTFPSL